MKEFETSETYKNILNAYVAESTAAQHFLDLTEKTRQSHNKEIKQLFRVIAKQNLAAAERLQTHLVGSSVEQTYRLNCLANKAVDFEQILPAELEEKQRQARVVYKQYAGTAKAEGFGEFEELFENLSRIEEHQAQMIETVIKEQDPAFEGFWICAECGHIYYGKRLPVCPVCLEKNTFVKQKYVF